MKKEPTYDIRNTLREMQEEYWRGLEAGEAPRVEARDYLVFALADERFGLLTTVAREVLRIPRLVRVPRLPEHLPGVINLRGQIVAVTDLRPLLGLPGRDLPARGQLVVAEAAGLTTALLTAKVEGIRSIPTGAIEPVSEGLGTLPREVLSGRVAEPGGGLMLLEMGRLLARPEFVIDQKGP